MIEAIIEQAARKAAPREACGVIVQDSAGHEKTIVCRNISENPNNFIMHPADYVAAEREGEIIAIWHTHPVTSSEPSLADVAACNNSGIPWFIYSLVDDLICQIMPKEVIIPLLGRQFVWGVFDCWTLIRDYYKQELGIIFPPIPPYVERFWEKGLNYYLDWCHIGNLEKVLGPPQAYDILLMQLHSPVPNHGAVLVPDGRIMHHIQNQLSCYSTYGNYWRRSTCNILRHRSML